MTFLFVMLIVGFSGIVAQILIMSELFISFSGNELAIAIILANWVMLEAMGAFFIGKISERSEERRVGKECRSRWSPYH